MLESSFQNGLTLVAFAMVLAGAGLLAFMGLRQARLGMQRRARLSDAAPA